MMISKKKRSMIMAFVFLGGSSGCYAVDFTKRNYSLKKDFVPPAQIVDRLSRDTFIEHLKKLKLGEISNDVVKDLGYAPDAYYPAPNKSLDQLPRHYVMHYIVSRAVNNGMHLEDQEVSIIFDQKERLISIMHSGVPEINQVISDKIPVVDMAKY